MRPAPAPMVAKSFDKAEPVKKVEKTVSDVRTMGGSGGGKRIGRKSKSATGTPL
jgi:hypothetical protein